MNFKTLGFICLLSVFATWLGWKYFTREEVVFVPPQPVVTASPPLLVQNTPDDLAELLAVPLTIEKTASSSNKVASPSAIMDFISEKKPGFVVLFGNNVSSASAKTALNNLKEIVDPKAFPLLAVDQEGGSVQRLSGAGFTKLPSQQVLCQMDSTTRKKLVEQSTLELKNLGVHIIFGPVVDVGKNNPILKDRICSDDSQVTLNFAQETIDVYFGLGIWPVLKHYPGIGASTLDLHTTIDALTEKPAELSLFDTLIMTYPKIGVMSTHILVKDLSEDAPCSLNPKCLEVFTTDYRQAVVFSDALDMGAALTGKDLVSKKSLSQVATEAILAGNHVLVFGKTPTAAELDQVLSQLKLEYTNNKTFKEKADLALEKVRTLRQEIQTKTK